MAITIDGDSGISGVNGSATTPALQGTDSNTGIVFGTDTVQIATGGSTRATVDSDGDLGIGTASPSALLHIAKSGGNAKLLIQRSNTASNTDDYGSIVFQSSAGNNNVLIGAARHSAENDAYMFFSTASGGTLSEELRIQSAGGISFNGDTAQANALSDYEQGSFTPGYNSAMGSPSYNVQSGHYTKVGNCVTFTLTLNATGINTGDQLLILGLPFSASSTLENGGATINYFSGNSGNLTQYAHIGKGNNYISFYIGSGASWVGVSGDGVSGKTFHLEGFYYI